MSVAGVDKRGPGQSVSRMLEHLACRQPRCSHKRKFAAALLDRGCHDDVRFP